MRKFVIAIIALVTLAGPAVCAADSLRTGGYMSGFIGANVAKDMNVDSEQYSPTVDTFSDRVSLDPGVNAGLTGGYNFGFFRLEGELSYKAAQIDEITNQYKNNGPTNIRYRNVDGDLDVLAFMFNAFFDLRNSTPVTPYFGGGVGLATVYISDTYGTDTSGVPTRYLLYTEDADTVPAYQIGGGLEIALNSVLSLDLSYRYFGTAKTKFNDDTDILTRLRYESHNAGIGLRIKF